MSPREWKMLLVEDRGAVGLIRLHRPQALNALNVEVMEELVTCLEEMDARQEIRVVVLAGDGDVGGLLGIHLHEEMKLRNAVVSIDGLELKEFDYIDIGAMLETTGAVPVVIKSLIFPGSAKEGAKSVGA